MPKFWHTYMITYSDFMVIVEHCLIGLVFGGAFNGVLWYVWEIKKIRSS